MYVGLAVKHTLIAWAGIWAVFVCLLGADTSQASHTPPASTLTQKEARHAAKVAAAELHDHPVRIFLTSRVTPRRIRVWVKWEYTAVDPIGCKGCGYIPDSPYTEEDDSSWYDTPSSETFYCSAHFKVDQLKHRIRTKLIPHSESCF